MGLETKTHLPSSVSSTHSQGSVSSTCQNCKNQFVIEPEDFSFYEKIKVPPPTWCPSCRIQRKLAFRNERSLYHSSCKLCGKNVIAIYRPETKVTIYCQDCWWSDSWDGMSYAREYDFARPFFVQFQELMQSVPRPNFYQRNTTNSPYANQVVESKDIYLAYSVVESDQIFYSKGADNSRNSFDCLQVVNAERSYWDVFGEQNYDCRFVAFSRGCIDSWFLYDCVNCQNCVLSTGQRNKRYLIRNKQCSKEEYFAELKKMNLGSYSAVEKARAEFDGVLRTTTVHRFAKTTKTTDSTGDNIFNTKNARYAFDGYDLENTAYSVRGFRSKDSMDLAYSLLSELTYEYTSGGRQQFNTRFCTNLIENLKNITYSEYCTASSDLFGCIGLKKKQYCIFNKQYTKDNYETMVRKIVEHMDMMPYKDKAGRIYKFGEFFPIDIAPYPYNDTIAQEHFPISPEKAASIGVSWKSPNLLEYAPTVRATDLPDDIKDVAESIVRETISCAHEGKCNDQCTTAFKIVPQEFEFYKQAGLPLPRLCPNCRHYERLKQRNPLKLWHRKCTCAGAKSENGVYQNTVKHQHDGACLNEFETSYAPDRPEIVYCESCYNAEVA